MSYVNFETGVEKDLDLLNKLSTEQYQIFAASGDDGASNQFKPQSKYVGPIISDRISVLPQITSVGGTIYINNKKIEVPCTYFPKPIPIIVSGGGMDNSQILVNV